MRNVSIEVVLAVAILTTVCSACRSATGTSVSVSALFQDPLQRALALYDRGEFAAALAAFEAEAKATGTAEAAYMAGLMHHRGRGTKVDGKAAIAWYERAAARNFAPALTNLGIVFRDGVDGQPADSGKAREYLRRATYLGDAAGQLAYAAMLVNAPTDAAERHEGLAFLQMLAEQGDVAARDNLVRLPMTADDRRAVADARKAIERNLEALRRLRESDRRPSGSTSATEPAHESGQLRFRRVAICDPMTDGQEALCMLLPADWEFEGRIEWLLADSVLANPHWRARDPRTGVTMQSLPYRHFTWNPQGVLPIGQNHLGMIVAPPPRDPAEFVAKFWMADQLPHLRDAELVARQELPALANLAVREWGGRADAQGWRLRYRFAKDGAVWHEDVVFALLFDRSGGGTWTVTRCHTVRGPGDALDRLQRITHAIAGSGQFTPRWIASWRVCQSLFRMRARQVMDGARQLAATFAENREHIQQLQREVEREREASWAAQAQLRREALGGVETWHDPVQARGIEMPQGFAEAWVNPRGEYLLFERPGGEPNVGSEVRWQKMERVDPMAGRTGR